MYNGTPGVQCSLSRDLTQDPSVIYGDGTDDENCHWRNSKYPNLRQDDAPVFPGRVFSAVGTSGADILTWSQEMHDKGYIGSPSSVYTAAAKAACKKMQKDTGIQVDGAVGPQTWAATFDTGSNGGDLSGAYFAPLYYDPAVEPYLYTAGGGRNGVNPAFRPDIRQRVEKFEAFGDRISLGSAVDSATKEVLRNQATAGWAGTITLSADPQQGSRFDIRAGHNIRVRGHRGTDRLMHISGMSVDWDNLSVTLTVDDRARDLITLAAVMQRNRDATDPVQRTRDYMRKSRIINDKIAIWDCENGAGIIPKHGTYRGLWNILRIPCAEKGTIVRARFSLDTPARMAACVFDRPVTANELARIGVSPLDEGFWEAFPEDHGLIIAWGGSDQAGGFYPGDESDGDPLTGVLQDDASWYYESTQPPYLWVGIWVENPTVNYCQGRLFAAVDDA